MRRVPFHPLLFATFPLLFLFVQNAERVRFGKVVSPLLLVLLFVTVVVALAFVVFRDLRRAAIVGSGFALLSLSYGHVRIAIDAKQIGGIIIGRDMFLLPMWVLLGLGFVAWAWRVRSLGEVTLILNVVAFGLVAVSAVNTTTAVAHQGGTAFQANAGKRSHALPQARGSGTERDIYYLIFDRYGSGPVLQKYLDYDDSSFLDALRERGFYVADRAQSNYPTTAHSLASSLNMGYLDHLTESEGRDSEDWKPLYRTIPDSRVPRFLLEQGYRYAHIGPWYDPTASDPIAHVNYHYDKRSEFSRVLIETTVVQPFAERVGFLKDLDGRQITHNQIRFQFESILDASELPGPTYTFAHILIPHEPFTFAADGSYQSDEDDENYTWEEGYIGQVKYANRRILEVVDELVAGPSRTDPIIVLQADEGPKRPGWTYGSERRWEDATDTELDQKVGILTALSLPGTNDADLRQDMTPVNTFRTIFNTYFGTELRRLRERIYVYGDGREPYRFTDISGRVR
jgi:hypothetical protein